MRRIDLQTKRSGELLCDCSGWVSLLTCVVRIIRKNIDDIVGHCWPGVLVLSRLADAARDLDAAPLVSPCDIDAMERALPMPLEGRRERFRSMMAPLNRVTSGPGARISCHSQHRTKRRSRVDSQKFHKVLGKRPEPLSAGALVLHEVERSASASERSLGKTVGPFGCGRGS